MLLLLHDGMSSNARSRSLDLQDYRACTSKGLSWFVIDDRGGRLPQGCSRVHSLSTKVLDHWLMVREVRPFLFQWELSWWLYH